MFVSSLLNKTSVLENYRYLIYDIGDPRVKNWILIHSPWPNFLFITTYLFLIYKFLPQFMKNRNAFNLQSAVFCYNIFQIVACTLLVYKIGTPISDPLYSLTCKYFDFTSSPQSLEILRCCYYYYLLKLAEFAETIMFGLRKKFNQISVLHVYHHVTTLLMSWFLTKYYGGGMTLFQFLINSFIHIFMYSYYLVASLGGQWQSKIVKWKSTLTLMQMIQFSIMVLHFTQTVDPKCGAPRVFCMLLMLNVMIFFWMFAVFYRRNYTEMKKNK